MMVISGVTGVAQVVNTSAISNASCSQKQSGVLKQLYFPEHLNMLHIGSMSLTYEKVQEKEFDPGKYQKLTTLTWKQCIYCLKVSELEFIHKHRHR